MFPDNNEILRQTNNGFSIQQNVDSNHTMAKVNRQLHNHLNHERREQPPHQTMNNQTNHFFVQSTTSSNEVDNFHPLRERCENQASIDLLNKVRVQNRMFTMRHKNFINTLVNQTNASRFHPYVRPPINASYLVPSHLVYSQQNSFVSHTVFQHTINNNDVAPSFNPENFNSDTEEEVLASGEIISTSYNESIEEDKIILDEDETELASFLASQTEVLVQSSSSITNSILEVATENSSDKDDVNELATFLANINNSSDEMSDPDSNESTLEETSSISNQPVYDKDVSELAEFLVTKMN